MDVFDRTIRDINKMITEEKFGKMICEQMDRVPCWPPAGHRDIVLKSHVGVELGAPRTESFSMVLWTNRNDLVSDGRITLIGPDVGAAATDKLPLGKIAIIGGHDFNEANAYDRSREMALAAYDISLKGYMLRSASHYMMEWVRISRDAVKDGFSLAMAGKALIHEYRKRRYVKTAEVILVTANSDAVYRLRRACGHALDILNAMRKMAEEMTFDCDTCEYQSVCGEVETLRAMARVFEDTRRKAG